MHYTTWQGVKESSNLFLEGRHFTGIREDGWVFFLFGTDHGWSERLLRIIIGYLWLAWWALHGRSGHVSKVLSGLDVGRYPLWCNFACSSQEILIASFDISTPTFLENSLP